jgi:hypothetical protein
MYEMCSKAPSEEKETREAAPLVPIVKPRGYVMSYNQWLEHFWEEAEDIINQYEDFILETCNKYGMICTANHKEFRERMAKLIYKTSMNRYKYYAAII